MKMVIVMTMIDGDADDANDAQNDKDNHAIMCIMNTIHDDDDDD